MDNLYSTQNLPHTFTRFPQSQTLSLHLGLIAQQASHITVLHNNKIPTTIYAHIRHILYLGMMPRSELYWDD